MKQIVLDLPPELADVLEHLGGRDDATMGKLVRDALYNDLRRRRHAGRKPPDKTLAPLQARIAEDIRFASNWSDLQRRIGRLGYQFVRRGGGLNLADLNGNHVCSAADLGQSHAQLMRQFGGPIGAASHSLSKAG